jgi:protein-disulfide isomerase
VNDQIADDRLIRLALTVGERDHVQGSGTAPVTLVEYGDYECPYCKAAVPIVGDLQRLLGDQLRFVFRHFPLTNLHPHAQRAAEAAEAAGVQGKFYEMHLSLFEHQDALEDDHLMAYAADLDLDAAQFRHELDAHTHASRVGEDVQGGLRSGVIGTPTFYLDGLRYDGLVSVRGFLSAVREAHPDVATDALEGGVGRDAIPRVVHQRSMARSAR